MKYVTPKQSKVLSALVLATLLSSCSLKSNNQSQTLTIALPGANWAQNPILKSMTEWISMAWAGSLTTASNLNDAPSALSEFDCFAVNVSGPGVNLDPNINCSDPNDAPAIFGGFVPNGNSSIDVLVPAGPDRTIRVLGVKTFGIGCPNLHDMVRDGSINDSTVGSFYEIGKTRQDIYSDATVVIHATYNSTSPTQAFSSCHGNGDNGGSHVWGVYAGTGPGNVNASKTVGGTSYVTGKFDYIGPDTHSGAIISQNQGTLASSNIAHINGTVNCAVTDGAGGYYVAGSMTGVESSTYANAGVIHIKGDGSWDSSFVISLNAGTVNTCLRDGSHLYLGGTFGQLIYNSGVPQTATALADFSLVTKTPMDLGLVATFDASPAVNAISLEAGRLYVGGYFTYSANSRHNAVAIDVSAAPAIDPNWHPEPTGEVSTVFHSGSTVYIGGSFSSINGSTPRSHLAQVDDTNGNDTGWDPSAELSGAMGVNAVFSDGSYVYVAATGSGGQSVVRLNLSNPSLAPATIFSTSTFGDSINTLAYSTYLGFPVLYMGGKFTTTGLTPQQGLVAYQNPAGAYALYSNFIANTNKASTVKAITPDAIGRLYVGGNFQSIGGVLRNNLAAYNLLSGVPTSWAPNISIGEGSSLVSDGTSIYLGYKSDSTYSIPSGVAKLSMDAAITTPLNYKTTSNYLDGDVNTIALSPANDLLYIGGCFTTMAGTGSLTGLAKFQTSDLNYVASWTPTLAASGPLNVTALLVQANQVYVGGLFNQVNGTTLTGTAGLVAFNTSDHNLMTGWTYASALSNGVQTIAVHPSGDLLVGAKISGPIIRRVNPSTGTVVTWTHGPSDSLMSSKMTETRALLVSGSTLYIGGVSNTTSGRSLVAYDLTNENILSFDPHLYNTYNPSLDAVNSLEAPTANLLLVGGQFSQANVTDSNGDGGKEAWGLGVINANSGDYY